MELKSNIPAGEVHERWSNYKRTAKLVNPANRRKLEIIVVGSGLAGASVVIRAP